MVHLPLLLGSTAFMLLTNSIYEPVYFLHGLGQASYLSGAETAIALQVDEEAMWKRTAGEHPVEVIKPAVHFLAEHHLSVFANPWLAMLGKPLPEVYPAANRDLKFTGVGFVDETKMSPAPGGRGVR